MEIQSWHGRYGTLTNCYFFLRREITVFWGKWCNVIQQRYTVIYQAIWYNFKDEKVKRRAKILACKEPSNNYRDIHNQLMNTNMYGLPKKRKPQHPIRVFHSSIKKKQWNTKHNEYGCNIFCCRICSNKARISNLQTLCLQSGLVLCLFPGEFQRKQPQTKTLV